MEPPHSLGHSRWGTFWSLKIPISINNLILKFLSTEVCHNWISLLAKLYIGWHDGVFRGFAVGPFKCFKVSHAIYFFFVSICISSFRMYIISLIQGLLVIKCALQGSVFVHTIYIYDFKQIHSCVVSLFRCWLKADFKWAFIAPVLAILTVNCAFIDGVKDRKNVSASVQLHRQRSVREPVNVCLF